MRRFLPAIAVVAACAEEPTAVSPPPVATSPTKALLELPDLKVRADGRDRFATCRNLPSSCAPPKVPVADAPTDGGHVANAERTIAALRKPFHDCFLAGLRKGSPAMARVSVSIDIAANGAVSQVRTGFSCGLDESALQCLEAQVGAASFDAPGGGGSKLLVPISFTTTTEVVRGMSEVALDMAALHGCYGAALGRAPHTNANATFRVQDGDAQIEAWEGDRDLLACAAAVLQRAGTAFSMRIRFEE